MSSEINDSRGGTAVNGADVAEAERLRVERMRLWGLVLLAAAMLCGVLQAASAMSGVGPSFSGVGVLALVLGFVGSVLIVSGSSPWVGGGVDVEGGATDAR